MPKSYSYTVCREIYNTVLNDVELSRSIFESVLGVVVSFTAHYYSPFRDDKKPGCYFKVSSNNRLYFVDNNGKNYNATFIISEKLGLDFFETAMYIDKHFINKTTRKYKKKALVLPSKIPTKTFFKERVWDSQDELFWRFVNNNIRNTIIAISEFNSYGKTYSGIGYALPFNENSFKLYFPEELNDTTSSTYRKWIGDNITSDNYWSFTGSDNLDECIITKSFKDAAAIFSICDINTYAFSSENTLPSNDILIEILSGYKKVIIVYDNDSTGINNGIKLKLLIQELLDIQVEIRFIKSAKDAYDLLNKFENSKLLSDELEI